jgi:membrane-associated phospholipid phosphatase
MFRKLLLYSPFLLCSLNVPSLMMAQYGEAAGIKDSLRVSEVAGDSLAIALDPQPHSIYPPIRWYSFIENIPRDWSQWAQTAFREDKIGDWALVAGLTTALFVTDDLTYTPSKRFFESSERAGYWSNFAAEIGDGRTQFGVGGAFAAYGLIFGDQRALRTGSQIVEVVLGAGAIVQVLKHVTGRESPFTRSSPTGVWKFFPDQIEYHKHVPAYDAFPSGHICTSMATVIVIAENYPEVKWVRPVGYLFCAVIAAGMANNGIHWYSDYPLGIFLGYAFGMIASHQELFTVLGRGDPRSPKVSLTPSINRYGPGLIFNLSF